jgi:hypothetical protein
VNTGNIYSQRDPKAGFWFCANSTLNQYIGTFLHVLSFLAHLLVITVAIKQPTLYYDHGTPLTVADIPLPDPFWMRTVLNHRTLGRGRQRSGRQERVRGRWSKEEGEGETQRDREETKGGGGSTWGLREHVAA